MSIVVATFATSAIATTRFTLLFGYYAIASYAHYDNHRKYYYKNLYRFHTFLLSGSLILPLLNSTIKVTTTTANAKNINAVHQYVPMRYIALDTMNEVHTQ